VRVFLVTQGAGGSGFRIELAGLLDDFISGFDKVDLPFHFELHRLAGKLHRVHVLDLAAGTEFSLALGADTDVYVAAQASFLHISVGNTEPADELAHAAELNVGFEADDGFVGGL